MRRSAFTLIEMLVVMTILAILFGLAFVAYAQSVAAAKVAATGSTILQLHRELHYREEDIGRRNVASFAKQLKAEYDTAGNPAPNDKLPLQLATLLVRKNMFRGALPQRLEDTWGIDGRPGTTDDSPVWDLWKRASIDNGIPVTDTNPRPTGHRMDLENSELLYLFLSQGPLFGAATFDVGRLNPAHVQDSNKNGLPEIVDSWGKPIRFYNWPTRLIRPGGEDEPIDQAIFAQTAKQFLAMVPPPATPSPFPIIDNSVTPPEGYYDHPINNDPDDPLGGLSAAQDSTGILMQPFWLNRNGSPAICNPFDEEHYHTLNTYHALLVISSGPDERLGLAEPTEQNDPAKRNADVESVGDTYDNVGVLP